MLPTASQSNELDHRFFLGDKVYNRMVSEAKDRVNCFFLIKEVKEIRKRMRKKGYELTEEEKRLLKNAREFCGLTEYAFHGFLTEQCRKYRNHLDSNTIQKLGTACWHATEAFLFGKGKAIHFKPYRELLSLEGKSNGTGIRFVNGQMKWVGMTIPVKIRKGDIYAQEALQNRVKYCRIRRSWRGKRAIYYLQLVLEGTPPPKRDRKTGEFKHHPLDAVAGYDPGTSVLAASSTEGMAFQEYGDDVERIDRQIRVLQRKLDRQRRANNPDNFMPDGQIRRLKHGEKRVWHNSRRYYATLDQLRALWRRRSAHMKESQCRTANHILDTVGKNLVIEKTSFASMAKRAKKTTINKKTGRPNSKTRFGPSELVHSPSRQITIVTQKAKSAGGTVIMVDPRKLKGSQYNHGAHVRACA